MDAPALTEQELNEIYNWVDTFNLSRPKKHISRDFADGVLMAEIMHHYVPKFVELHNYSPAHSIQQKQYNWSTMNAKVFKKMGFQITTNDSDSVINCVPEAVERVLRLYMDQQKYQPVNSSIDGGRNIKNANVQQQKIKQPMDQGPQKDYRSVVSEKEMIIQDQRETIEILELKIQKLEQLVKLKDSKIQTLMSKQQGNR